MLNNPFWNVSLDNFIAWLETKDPEAEYDFNNCEGECLTGQYMAHLDIPWNVISMGGVDRPWTYGAALKRARIAKEA